MTKSPNAKVMPSISDKGNLLFKDICIVKGDKTLGVHVLAREPKEAKCKVAHIGSVDHPLLNPVAALECFLERSAEARKNLRRTNAFFWHSSESIMDCQ
ncbi:hypothetical protein DM01DRAFT_1011537 [Hesseltinella vesiculosa]|uniref:Uncharacterized protein n=1 Tax=Hesseltinella vesiculosa TaxID=101127 RepID=A0A1X2GYJ3_9FUNG|nr:hypothetical protein DM01DRAFT_1011537 [Hesseltinella vesiculosa]